MGHKLITQDIAASIEQSKNTSWDNGEPYLISPGDLTPSQMEAAWCKTKNIVIKYYAERRCAKALMKTEVGSSDKENAK